jgi:membrane protein YqaA with SNARE-associated domain
MDNPKKLLPFIRQFFQRKYWKLWLLLALLVVITVVPLIVYKPDIQTLKSLGYVGYFIANYFGWGVYTLPFLVTKLNPVLLVIIGAFGSTIDEYVTWSLGKAAQEVKEFSSLSSKLDALVDRFGVGLVFVMGILPTPGFITNMIAIICGHYGIPFRRYFLAAIAGRLISRTLWTYGFLYLMNRYTPSELLQLLSR